MIVTPQATPALTNNFLRPGPGRSFDGFYLEEKWNRPIPLNAHGVPAASKAYSKFFLRQGTAATSSDAIAIDANRNIPSGYTDITVLFDDDMKDVALSVGGTATGHSIKIAGASQTTTYRSGSGTARWTLRVPLLVPSGAAIAYSYNPSTGNTRATTNNVELPTITDKAGSNLLSLRVRFVLKTTAAPVASETVDLAVFRYAGGSVASSSWMTLEMALNVMTDSSGVIDIPYVGSAASGDTVYVAVLRPDSGPTHSLLWTSVVV